MMHPYLYAGLDAQMQTNYHILKPVEHFTKKDLGSAIIAITARYYKVSSAKMKTPLRTRELTIARQVVMYFLRRFTTLSLKSTGKIFGRDHSSVIYAIDTVKDLMFTDKDYLQHIKNVEELIKEFRFKNETTFHCGREVTDGEKNFPTIKSAAEFYGIKHKTLCAMLSGQIKNNTNLKFKNNAN